MRGLEVALMSYVMILRISCIIVISWQRCPARPSVSRCVSVCLFFNPATCLAAGNDAYSCASKPHFPAHQTADPSQIVPLVIQLLLPHHPLHKHLAHTLRLLRITAPAIRIRLPDRELHNRHFICLHSLQIRDEPLIIGVHPAAAVERELERLQLSVVAQMSEDRHEGVVVHEAPLVMRHGHGIETRRRVFELEAQVADEGGVGRADGLDELADALLCCQSGCFQMMS